jgi:hypothetical protein
MKKEETKTLDFSNLTPEQKKDYLTNIWLKDEMTKIYDYCKGDRTKMKEILYLMPFNRELLPKIDKLIFDFKDLKEDTMKTQKELFDILYNSNKKNK